MNKKNNVNDIARCLGIKTIASNYDYTTFFKIMEENALLIFLKMLEIDYEVENKEIAVGSDGKVSKIERESRRKQCNLLHTPEPWLKVWTHDSKWYAEVVNACLDYNNCRMATEFEKDAIRISAIKSVNQSELNKFLHFDIDQNNKIEQEKKRLDNFNFYQKLLKRTEIEEKNKSSLTEEEIKFQSEFGFIIDANEQIKYEINGENDISKNRENYAKKFRELSKKYDNKWSAIFDILIGKINRVAQKHFADFEWARIAHTNIGGYFLGNKFYSLPDIDPTNDYKRSNLLNQCLANFQNGNNGVLKLFEIMFPQIENLSINEKQARRIFSSLASQAEAATKNYKAAIDKFKAANDIKNKTAIGVNDGLLIYDYETKEWEFDPNPTNAKSCDLGYYFEPFKIENFEFEKFTKNNWESLDPEKSVVKKFLNAKLSERGVKTTALSLARIIDYTSPFAVVLNHIGKEGSGKSTFFDAFAEITGEHFRGVVNTKKMSQSNFAKLPLFTSLWVIQSENSSAKIEETGDLKATATGDLIDFEKKFKDVEKGRFGGTMINLGNDVTKTKVTKGVERRNLFSQWTLEKVDFGGRDVDLKKALLEDSTGFLYLVMHGIELFIKHVFEWKPIKINYSDVKLEKRFNGYFVPIRALIDWMVDNQVIIPQKGQNIGISEIDDFARILSCSDDKRNIDPEVVKWVDKMNENYKGDTMSHINEIDDMSDDGWENALEMIFKDKGIEKDFKVRIANSGNSNVIKTRDGKRIQNQRYLDNMGWNLESDILKQFLDFLVTLQNVKEKFGIVLKDYQHQFDNSNDRDYLSKQKIKIGELFLEKTEAIGRLNRLVLPNDFFEEKESIIKDNTKPPMPTTIHTQEQTPIKDPLFDGYEILDEIFENEK